MAREIEKPSRSYAPSHTPIFTFKHFPIISHEFVVFLAALKVHELSQKAKRGVSDHFIYDWNSLANRSKDSAEFFIFIWIRQSHCILVGTNGWFGGGCFSFVLGVHCLVPAVFAAVSTGVLSLLHPGTLLIVSWLKARRVSASDPDTSPRGLYFFSCILYITLTKKK
nr:uncharacterized protein LOC118683563 [Bactrocera oleae]